MRECRSTDCYHSVITRKFIVAFYTALIVRRESIIIFLANECNRANVVTVVIRNSVAR